MDVFTRQWLCVVAFDGQSFPAEIPYTETGVVRDVQIKKAWPHGGIGSGGHPGGWVWPDGTIIVAILKSKGARVSN